MDGAWTIAEVLTGIEPVCAEPFEAIGLDLRAVWGDPTASR